VSRRIDLHGQSALGEVDLDGVGAGCETATDLRLVLVQQIVDELFSRVPRKVVGWIHETQGGREMTACFTGSCVWRCTSRRKLSAYRR
jgi:hypothetical protein